MNNKTKQLLFLLFTLTVGVQSLRAQDQPDLRDRAERFFKEYQYAKAASIYLQLADVQKPYLHDMENLAISYSKMNRYEDAEIWFARVVQHPKSSLSNLISYGRILKANAHYIKAREVFLQYAKKSGKSDQVAVDIAGCDSAQVWIGRPTAHKLKNEQQVNTARSEFSVLPLDESAVYYTAEPELKSNGKKYGWTGNSFLRVFSAKRTADNSLSLPIEADLAINKEVYHVGPVATNKARDIFFFTRTYPGKKSGKATIDGKTYRTNRMELYIWTKVYGKWRDPEPFAFNNVKKYSIGHATLSKDEKILYFVSDMPGGYGGTDIWYSELQGDGSWGECKNAGREVNTAGNELFPVIASDGLLYYSSDGLPGMGGLDVFRAKGERGKWAKPVNLRYPLNSPGDDFAYMPDTGGRSGYLSSNRENGKGGDDIYSYSVQKNNASLLLEGIAYDKKTRQPLPDAAVTLFDNNNNIVARQQSGPDGAFAFELDKSTPYRLQGTKFSYYPDTTSIPVRPVMGNDTIARALYLDPLFEKGKIFRLKNILYDFDKDNIRQDAALILDELVRILHENPTLKIELGSHTDCRGTTLYNQDLSQRRAQSAVNYLVSRGIARSRMIAKGYGESRLLNRCADNVECSEEEHQLNRRTEFTVLEY